jgi:DNA replication ATP-dependent helicase Dna2
MTVANVREMEAMVDKARVVGVTCLGITHAMFGKRKFDVCIVDEAGQITLPVCLGPLRCANTFVLVGDHYQLPPLVRVRSATTFYAFPVKAQKPFTL